MASVSIVYRKDKLNKNNEAPVHFRIIKDRKTTYISSTLMIPFDNWDFTKNKVKAKNKNSARLNAFLSNKYSELQDKVLEEETKAKSITTRQLRDSILGKKPTDFFAFAEGVVSKYLEDDKIGTYDRNCSIVAKVKKYVGNKNLTFYDIDLQFLMKYETYLKLKLHNSTNTVANNYKFLKKIFNDAYSQDIIEHKDNPFLKFKIKTEQTESVYLSEEELHLIDSYKPTEGTRMDLHKDMFVFASYCGLRVSDVLKLQWKNFDNTNINFIVKKTKTQLSIKIPNRGLEILMKYKPKKVKGNDFIFPIFTEGLNIADARTLDSAISSGTAYINKNLKIIAKKVGLDKRISFHASRHTFATRAIRKGIGIDKVSKIMAHTTVRQTQHYAKIVNSELDKAMDAFND